MEVVGQVTYVLFYGAAIFAVLMFAIPAYRHPERYVGWIDYTLAGAIIVIFAATVVDQFLPLVCGALLLGVVVAVKRRMRKVQQSPWPIRG